MFYTFAPIVIVYKKISFMDEKKLSHTDSSGKAHMVDVGHKPSMIRIAKAEGFIRLQPATLKLIAENQVKKGDVLTVAEIAGIQAAKQTHVLIPLCHPLPISHVGVVTRLTNEGISASAEVSCTGNTGVEMEALTAVSVALLTIYDMCKAVDKQMTLHDIRLIEKTKSTP
jgi:cyclic pyranopterin monophosphate synthase